MYVSLVRDATVLHKIWQQWDLGMYNVYAQWEQPHSNQRGES